MRRLILTAAAATLSTMAAAPAFADAARDAEALSALRAIIANPATPPAPVLGQYSFRESQFLVDKLTGTEQRQLGLILRNANDSLQGGIDTAIRAKAARPLSNGPL